MAPHVVKPRLPQLENISMNDFQCQAVLGRGHFGKVKTVKSQTPTSILTFLGTLGSTQKLTANVCNKSSQKG